MSAFIKFKTISLNPIQFLVAKQIIFIAFITGQQSYSAFLIIQTKMRPTYIKFRSQSQPQIKSVPVINQHLNPQRIDQTTTRTISSVQNLQYWRYRERANPQYKEANLASNRSRPVILQQTIKQQTEETESYLPYKPISPSFAQSYIIRQRENSNYKNTDLNQLNDSVKSMMKNNESYRQELLSAHNQKAKTIYENAILQKKWENAEKEKETMTLENQQLQISISGLEREIQFVRENNRVRTKKYEADIRQLNQELSKYRSYNEDLSKTKKFLDMRVGIIPPLQEKIQWFKQGLEETSKQLQKTQHQLTANIQKSHTAEREYFTLLQNFNYLKKNNQQLNLQLQRFKAQYGFIQKSYKQLQTQKIIIIQQHHTIEQTLNTLVSSRTQDNQGLMKKLIELGEDCRKRDQKINQYEKSIKVFIQEKNRLNGALQLNRKQLAQSQRQRLQLNRQVIQKNVTLQTQSIKFMNLQQEINMLISQHQNKQSLLKQETVYKIGQVSKQHQAKLGNYVNKWQEQLGRINNVLQDKKRQINTQKMQIEKQNRINQQNRVTMQQKQIVINKLQQQIKRLSQNQKMLNDTISNCKNTISEFQNKLTKELWNHSQTAKNYQDIVKNNNNKINILEGTFKETVKNYEGSMKEGNDKIINLQQMLRQVINSKEDIIKDNTNKIINLQQTIKDTTTKYQARQKADSQTILKLQQNLKEEKQFKDKLQVELKNGIQSMTNLLKQKTNYYEGQINSINLKNNNLSQRLNQFLQELKLCKNDLNQKDQQIKNQKDMTKKLTETVLTLRAKAEQLQNQRELLQEIAHENQITLAKNNQEIEKLNLTFNGKVNQSMSDIEMLRTVLQQQRGDLAKCQQEKRKLLDEVNNLRGEDKRYLAAEQTLRNLKKEFQQITKIVQQLNEPLNLAIKKFTNHIAALHRANFLRQVERIVHFGQRVTWISDEVHKRCANANVLFGIIDKNKPSFTFTQTKTTKFIKKTKF